MKGIYKVLALASLLCAFASCTTKLEVHRLGDPSTYVAPTMLGPGTIDITAEDIASDAPVTFSWSPADFGQPTEIVYSILCTYNGKSATLFSNITGKSYDAKSSELNDKLTTLGVPAGSKVKADFSISSTIGTDFVSVTSSTYSVNVTLPE